MHVADDSFVSFGVDGVFRSYAGNGTVIDYRQLYPDQIAVETTSKHYTLPAEAYGDGRLVKYIDHLLQLLQLLQPWQLKWEEDEMNSIESRSCNLTEASTAILERELEVRPCNCIACKFQTSCYFAKSNEDCTWCKIFTSKYGTFYGYYE
ncbi:hypothetical protein N431DRAFT_464148 [Stipitochalara longipes BDJ]|nr:hypothetical protein N431DRAFT_464148 [Stipitochalara longipes BDJ]